MGKSRMNNTLVLHVSCAVGLIAQVAVSDVSHGLMCRTSDVYLEGTGTQSIDTGCTLGPQTRIVADFSYDVGTRTTYTYHLWGFQNDEGGQGRAREFMYLQNGDKALATYNKGWGKAPGTCGSQIRHWMDYDLQHGTMTIRAGRQQDINVGYVELTRGDDTSTKTFCLYSYHHDNEWAGGLPSLRIYSFKIYEAGKLVRDMIPYGYGAQTGLVDRVTGKIFTDQRNGPTPFRIGCDESSVRSVHNTYLDTGYHVSNKTKLAIDFAVNVRRTQQRIFSCEGGNGAWLSLYCNDRSRLARGMGDGQLNGQDIVPDVVANGSRVTYVVDFPGGVETLTSGRQTLFSGSPAHAPTQVASLPLALCCKATLDGNGNVQLDNFADVEIYSCKIWHEGQLVRDYVPRVTDNMAGLYDRQNSTFLTATVTPLRQNQLEWYGNVETVRANGASLAANGDAYLLSHMNEGINIGYYIQPNSRMEVDYSWYYPRGTEFVLGLSSYLFIYGQQSDSLFANACYAGGWGGSGSSGNSQASERRTRIDIDMTAQKCRYYAADEAATTPFFTVNMNSLTQPSTLPVSLFGRTKLIDDAISCDGTSEIKLYSFKIYEGDVLKHAYYPACTNTVAGLRDLVTGVFLGRTFGNMDFEMGGGGYDGLGQVFALHPLDVIVPVHGVKTLTARAPGADGYQWFRNGQPIDGAVSEKLQVCWRSGVPRADTYLCVARYANWGYAESSVATVSFMRPGGVAIIK